MEKAEMAEESVEEKKPIDILENLEEPEEGEAPKVIEMKRNNLLLGRIATELTGIAASVSGVQKVLEEFLSLAKKTEYGEPTTDQPAEVK